ncbi:MAG: hypothetical protein IJA34_13580 [Lachnospiraceae bacterium]|nr:hypothetical protein [Lachnospiraceae bacterium]
MNINSSQLSSILKTVAIILILIFIGTKIYSGLSNEITDITSYVNYEKEDIEKKLDVKLTPNPKMVNKIYRYSKSTVTVDGDNKNGIAMVYFDGKRSGLHIDNKQYSLFNIHLGYTQSKAEDVMSFEYDYSYSVINDLMDGSSTAYFYCNSQNNTCLVLVFNGSTNRIVALTYFNDMKKATEKLSKLY